MAKDFEVVYDDKNFDPGPVRKMLGLDGNSIMFMPKEEALRMANLLNRTGNLTGEDLKKLKMIIVPRKQKK